MKYKNTAQEADLFFHQLKADTPLLESLCRHIDNELNRALETEEIPALLSLGSYIESGEGSLAWKYLGEVRRLLRILQIIQLEVKYGLNPLSSGCRSKEELLEKYTVMIFAIRRLIFDSSEEGVVEAEQFLQMAGCSPFALYMALQNELLPSEEAVYQRLERVCGSSWNEGERLLFAEMARAGRREAKNTDNNTYNNTGTENGTGTGQ